MADFENFLHGMDEADMNIDEVKHNLLDAIRYFTGNIVEQQLSPKVPTHELISALSGLVYTLLTVRIPKELIAFSKHANRKVIQDEDLYLFARKTSLREMLIEYRNHMIDSPSPKIRSKKNKTDDSE